MENNYLWNSEESRLDPVTLLHDILSNWWVILMGAISAALLINVVMSERYVPQYTTTATFAVTSKSNANSFSGINSTNEMAQTFESILQSNSMRKLIKEELGDEALGAQISSYVLGETNLLELKVTASTSKEAVNTIRVIMGHYEEVSFYSLSDAKMVVLAEPSVPMYPDNPLNVWYYMKKAFVIAAMFLVGLIGLISYFRDTIKQESDIERKLDARNIGVIPFERKYKTFKEIIAHKKGALLVTNPIAGFSFVESYKKIAIKIEYQMRKSQAKAIVVTSISENEGKSTVAANLAITLAEQGKKVTLVEGDLRRPSQFLIFEKKLKKQQEIGEFLKGNLDLEKVIVESKIKNLHLVLGKNCYSSSTEMLDSRKIKALLEVLKAREDIIIIDSPPVGLIGDAEILAKYADSVLFVIKQNYILAEDINDILDSFRANHAKVLGVVLNSVRSIGGTLGSGYYGRYGKYSEYEKYANNYMRNRGND